MSNPAFTFTPSYGVQNDKKPKLATANFGDGYQQRLPTGINNNPESWSLVFTAVNDATAASIMMFLDGMAQGQSFPWTNLDGVTNTFTCAQYSRSHDDEDKNTIRAQFTQVFGE